MNTIVESFSNATSKVDEFVDLLAEFPDLFSAKPLLPVNIPKFSDITANCVPNAMKNSLHAERWSPSGLLAANSELQTVPELEKFSSQSERKRAALKKSMLYEIMTNKEKYEFFANFLEAD